MKDNFSTNSDEYAKYRPTYPPAFFEYLNLLLKNKQNAWDCGTGNGQIASELAKTFENVFATDISQSQLDNAIKKENIFYSLQPAEKTDFDDGLFDLIIVAQAIHWFDFDEFYKEVNRTGKKDALLCVVGYGRIEINEQVDNLINDFYKNVVGKYWDKERKYVDENYRTIPFPFSEIKTPMFVNEQQWTLDHLIGYLNTWSAVKHFVKQNGFNPVNDLVQDLEKQWQQDEIKQIRFPLLLRMGIIKT